MAHRKILNQCPKIGNYASIAVDEFTKDPQEMEDFVQSVEVRRMREKIYILRKLKRSARDGEFCPVCRRGKKDA